MRLGAWLGLSAALGCVSPYRDSRPADAFQIGALLPFTGRRSSSAELSELAMLSAAEELSSLGGVKGRSIAVYARDTRSDTVLGLQAARSLIDERGVETLLGPADSALVRLLRSILAREEVVQISGDVTAAPDTSIDDGDFVFQVVPSIPSLAATLAAVIAEDGVGAVALAHVDDDYGSAFAAAAACSLGQAGVSVVETRAISESDDDGEAVRAVATSGAQAVMLIGYPLSAASVVQQVRAFGAQVAWYLAPSLRDDRLLQNVAPMALEGARGVAPAPAPDASIFEDTFQKRWGVASSSTAPFYFDGTVLLGLAARKAARTLDRLPTGPEIRDQLRSVSRPPGERVSWNELDRAVSLIDDGIDIDYRGVSGAVDLDAEGRVERGLAEVWSIQNGQVETEDDRFAEVFTPCP